MVKMMKGLFVFVVITIFVLSIMQMALAENNGSDDSSDNASDITSTGEKLVDAKEDVKDTKDLRIQENEKLKGLNKEKKDLKESVKAGELDKKFAKEKAKELKDEKSKEKEVLSKAKEQFKQATEVLKKARDNYEAAKENFKSQRNEHAKEREDLLKLKKESKACKAEDVDCKHKKDDIKKGIEQHLVKTVELMVTSFEKLKVRIEGSNVLTDVEKIEALASIAQVETSLNAQKAKVEALATNATNEDLKAAVKDLKSAWQDAMQVQRKLVAQLINSKSSNMVEKHGEYANAMQMRIDNLKAKGVDVIELEGLQAKFKEAQVQLEKDQAAALDVWKQAENKADALGFWKEAQTVVKEDMEKTKEILREFLAKYKELVQGDKESKETQPESNDSATTPETNTSEEQLNATLPENVSATTTA